MMTVEQLYNALVEMDTLDAVQADFEKEVAGAGGAAWAIERYSESVFRARMMARLVRPLIEKYPEIGHVVTADQWMAQVAYTVKETTDRLLNGYGRHNSTSLLQNAINQWEADSMAWFINHMKYYL